MSSTEVKQELICERCNTLADQLWVVGQENDEGEMIYKSICWSCDHDVCNGGDLFGDTAEILMDRAENDYAFDPINAPKPDWLP